MIAFRLLVATYLLLFVLTAKANSQIIMNYPDNFRQSREMILDDDHYKNQDTANRDLYRYMFTDTQFKVRTHPVKVEKLKKSEVKFKNGLTMWQLVMDRLQPSNIFDMRPLTDQLNTPQKMLAVASMGYLFDNDRKIFNDLNTGMKQSKFWKNNGTWLSHACDGFAEVGVAGILSLTGNKKNQQVALMLMESAMSLRVIYLKRLLGVSRPSEGIANIGPSLNLDALPSGHTWVAFSMATILGEAYEIKWLTYPLALFSGLSRIQQHTHWPSDVLAGGLMGHLEARTILARHGYLANTDIAESHCWDRTRVDADGGFRLIYDSYANIESKDKILDRIGRISWRWRMAQKLSPSVYLQANYHWRGQIPSIVSYNSMEDMDINPRMAFRLNRRTAFIAGYSYNKVQFNDLGTSPIEPDRIQLPAGLNYINIYGEKRFTGDLWYNLSDKYYLKAGYSHSTLTYDKFRDIYSRGDSGSLEIGTAPYPEKPTTFLLHYNYGNQDAVQNAYSYTGNTLRASLTQKIFWKMSLNASYLREDREYDKWNIPGQNPQGTWQAGGLELTRNFADSWTGEIGYYSRSLTSNVSGWPYNKNLYFVNLVGQF